MNTLIDKQFEFNLWANTEIIKLCTSLDETQLSVEITGTFGDIRATISHMIQSEGIYLTDLGGEPLWPDDLDWHSISLSELLGMAKQSGTALRQVAISLDVPHPGQSVWGYAHSINAYQILDVYED